MWERYTAPTALRSAVDLHELSAPVARTVVRAALADARRHNRTDECQDLIVITGRGKHSAEN
ncbi:MAG: hypothetical protein AAF411_24920, partial [Myxococcota bacterium]